MHGKRNSMGMQSGWDHVGPGLAPWVAMGPASCTNLVYHEPILTLFHYVCQRFFCKEENTPNMYIILFAIWRLRYTKVCSYCTLIYIAIHLHNASIFNQKPQYFILALTKVQDWSCVDVKDLGNSSPFH